MIECIEGSRKKGDFNVSVQEVPSLDPVIKERDGCDTGEIPTSPLYVTG